MLGLDNDPIRTGGSGLSAPPLPTGTLATEDVPQALRTPPAPLAKLVLPIVMVAAISAVVAVMALSGRGLSPMYMIFPLMMLMGLLTALNPPEKAGDIDESRRVYLRHLDALTSRARTNARKQRAHATFYHPHPSWLSTAVDTSRIWERTGDNERALQVRLGLGTESLCTPVEVSDPGSPEDLDPVCAVSLRRTVAAVTAVPDMPIVVQLDAFGHITLAGPRAADLARSIIIQLAFFHGPELVGFEGAGEFTDIVKWLPHSQDAPFVVSFDRDADCRITVTEDPDAPVLDGSFHLICRDDALEVATAGGIERLGTPDHFCAAEAEFIARNLAFYRRPVTDTGIGEVVWSGRELRPDRLKVAIGTGTDGEPVHLDLKEAAHGGMGPHGLCIGATGSGKSELLRTLVTALAATHSPNELNFVLVDFKGGATFLGAEKLPHTSAVITNLDNEAVLVERMHDALSGELHRRQELLRAAGNFANVTDYTEARLTTRFDLAPLPALVIVVDEFSELLGQHPDFADLFVAIGRLGRSLGIHLLLASQRLEEGKLRGLDSHLSYRIGLKTFSAAESRQVLGIPDAHSLPNDPGAGFLKAGGITRFKAAYVSGPTRVPVLANDGAVTLFTEKATEIAHREGASLMDTVVDTAARRAAALGQSAHQVWLPPLPARIDLPNVCESPARLQVTIGLIDEPYHQRQDPLVVDLARGHVAIAGGPQTGKSMFVRTLVTSLAATHTDLAIYIVDAGHGGYAALEDLPHVAAVAAASDVERTRRVVDEIFELVETPRGETVLVVDGWHALTAQDGPLEDLKDPLARIASEGPAVGVRLVVTTQRWSAIRSNVRDLIGTRYELALAEPLESLIDRKAQAALPAAPGRGLTAESKQMLVAATDDDVVADVVKHSDALPVPRLKMLPTRVDLAELRQGDDVLLGVGGRSLGPLPWAAQHLFVTGAAGSGKSSVVGALVAQLRTRSKASARMVIIDPKRAHSAHAHDPMVAAYAGSADAARKAIVDTAATLTARLPGAEVTAEQLAERSWWEGPDIYLLIDDLDLIGEEHLRPLVSLLPHAADIGFHVAAARKFGGITRALLAPFGSALRDQLPDAIVLSGNREEGVVFGVKPTPAPPGRGTYVHAGEPSGPIQVAVAP